MTQKETNLRSVIFLVIGILLLLSLIICICIVSGERDLVKTNAEVSEVRKGASSSCKNDITVNYDVDGQSYKYSFCYNNDVKEGDKVTLYYHENNPISVQRFKTNKFIFIWPVLGLALCILGIFELFKKNDEDDEDELQTSVIGVVGNTQQLKIVTDDTVVEKYEKTPEEKVEPEVRAVVKNSVVEISTDNSTLSEKTSDNLINKEEKESDSKPVVVAAPVIEEKTNMDVSVVQTPPPIIDLQNKETQNVEKDVVEQKENVVSEKAIIPEITPANKMVEAAPSPTKKVEEAIAKKVQSNVSGVSSLSEDDIKKVIKDVLKEVIQEVKEAKTPTEPVVQKRVLPNYYYISGTSLIYEEVGKEPQEIELKTIKSVVRTINSVGNVVKLVVSNDAIKCVLTNMKNIDLEQLASLLNNKMRTIDEDFQEEIEYKEY